jgi:hypothetical protein
VATFPGLAAAEVNVDTSGGDDYLAEMSDADIARFRAQAKEYRLQAELSVRDTDKDAWLKMTGEWDQLAHDAEQRRKR